MSVGAPVETSARPSLSFQPNWQRWTVVLASAAVVGMFLVNLCELTFVDPDLWHEMALARETLALGRLPWEDRFAYTPTVFPVVHHEWATGFILYGVASTLGAPGIMALKYALTLGVAAMCVWTARRRGASSITILSLAPAIVLAGCYGFTTIRAQLFTMFFFAVLLNLLDLDARGRRWWMALWLPMFLLWLNVHAGFVVGLLVLGAYTLEQIVRRQPFVHLIVLGLVMVAMAAVNPYGVSYYGYLAEGLTMARPMILEWLPLWKNDSTTFCVYLLSVLVVCYAAANLGPRNLPGLLIVALTGYEALMHTRHLSLYFVAWLSYAPAWLQQTPLAGTLESLWTRRRAWVAGFSAVIAVMCMSRAVPSEFWKMKVPVTPADEKTGRPMYPAGAVDYLIDTHFHGNLMVPFVPGGFVMWKLHPNVKVSLDGRYEVAYQHGILEENESLYTAADGWQKILARYPTDVILVPRTCKLAEVIDTAEGWTQIYRDGAYELYARSGLDLPVVDRGEVTSPAQFP